MRVRTFLIVSVWFASALLVQAQVALNSTAIANAISAASNGDTISLASGSASGISININKAVKVVGGQYGMTTLSGASVSITSTTAGWRLGGITFTNCGHNVVEVSGINSGVIDNCSFAKTSGTELIHIYGDATSWATDSTIGGAGNVYIEDCTFTGGNGGSDQSVQGNYNARFVVRFCTSNGYKLDAHGIWSNGSTSYCDWDDPGDAAYISDEHSARHFEWYFNTINSEDYYAMEPRGGTGMIFFNSMGRLSGGNSRYPMLRPREYCFNNPNDGNCCGVISAASYPYRDQLGRGKNQALEPMYIWKNTLNTSANILPSRDDGDWNPAGYFDHNRDYFQQLSVNGTEPGAAATFNGSSGVGVGTKAQMLAITATVTGVGFWVTDEGEWNSTNGATADGQLYAWNGSSWVLKYTPYTYPHPLRDGEEPPTAAPDAPTSPTATATSATSITVGWTPAVGGADETSFRVERSTVGGDVGFSEIASVAANVTTYVDDNLTPGTTYHYRLKARNAGGDSAYTSEVSATTDPPPPAEPVNHGAIQILRFGKR